MRSSRLPLFYAGNFKLHYTFSSCLLLFIFSEFLFFLLQVFPQTSVIAFHLLSKRLLTLTWTRTEFSIANIGPRTTVEVAAAQTIKNFSRSSTFLLHIFYYPFGVPAKPTFLYLVKQNGRMQKKQTKIIIHGGVVFFEDSCRDGSLLGNICGRFSFSRYSSLIALFLIQLCCDCKFHNSL